MVSLFKRISLPIVMASALALPVSPSAEKPDLSSAKNSISVSYHKYPESTTPSFMKLDFSRKMSDFWKFGIESTYLDRNRNPLVHENSGEKGRQELKLGIYSGPSLDLRGFEINSRIGVDFGNIYYKSDISNFDLFYKLGFELPLKDRYKLSFSVRDSFFEHKRPSFGIGLKVKF